MQTAGQRRPRTELKRVLDRDAKLFYDRLAKGRAEGTFEVKRSYFYHHGVYAQDWAAKVAEALERAGAPFKVVGSRDDYRNWPQESYLVAVVQHAEPQQATA
jgi:hypothetical protein